MPEQVWHPSEISTPRWPLEQDCRGFRGEVSGWFDGCTDLSIELLSLLAIGLDLQSDQFHQAHSWHDHVLELKQYPALPLGAEQMRLPDHADLTSLSILVQDASCGLQVWDDDVAKDWLDVPAFGDQVLVNTGLFMSYWTDGYLKATRHRVISREGDSLRHSAVFFCTPNWDSSLAPQVPGRRNEPEEGYDMVGDIMPFG